MLNTLTISIILSNYKSLRVTLILLNLPLSDRFIVAITIKVKVIPIYCLSQIFNKVEFKSADGVKSSMSFLL